MSTSIFQLQSGPNFTYERGC